MGTWDSERRREYYREYQKTPKYRARRGEYDRRYREKNREKIREQNRQYRDRNRDKPEWRAGHAAKQRRYQERKRQKIATIHEGRALAFSSGLGRTAVVFDDNDVVDLLRIAVEREGGQGAFSRHSGVDRAYLSRVLNGKEPPGRSIAKSLRLRKVYIVK